MVKLVTSRNWQNHLRKLVKPPLETGKTTHPQKQVKTHWLFCTCLPFRRIQPDTLYNVIDVTSVFRRRVRLLCNVIDVTLNVYFAGVLAHCAGDTQGDVAGAGGVGG